MILHAIRALKGLASPHPSPLLLLAALYGFAHPAIAHQTTAPHPQASTGQAPSLPPAVTPAASQPGGASPAAAPPADTGSSPISAERPGFTSGTDTIPPHSVQLELGYLADRVSHATVQHMGDQSQIRLPIGANSEYRLGLPAFYFGGGVPGGLTDSAITVKWRFLEENPGRRPSFAFIGGSSLPTGSPALTAGGLQPGADLESQFTLSTLFQLQANASAAASRFNGSTYDQCAATFGVNYAINPITSTFLQVYRQTVSGDSAGAPSASYLATGVTSVYRIFTQFDINGGVGISRENRGDAFVGAGYSRRW